MGDFDDDKVPKMALSDDGLRPLETKDIIARNIRLANDRAKVKELELKLLDAERKISELESKLTQDNLTGFINRRGLEQEITRAIDFINRYGSPSSLIFYDFSDTIANQPTADPEKGARFHHSIADTFQNNVRSSDIIGRFGPAQYIIFMWFASPEVATVRAYLMELILNRTFKISPKATKENSAQILWGVTSVNGHDKADDVIRRAKKAMKVSRANFLEIATNNNFGIPTEI